MSDFELGVVMALCFVILGGFIYDLCIRYWNDLDE